MNNQPVRNLKMHDGLHEVVAFIKIVDFIDLFHMAELKTGDKSYKNSIETHKNIFLITLADDAVIN
jgi:cytochrome b561